MLQSDLPFSERLLMYGDGGCLHGDSLVTINRGGKGMVLPIKDLVHRFNGGAIKGGSVRYWDLDIPTRVAYSDGVNQRSARLARGYYSGIKECLELHLANGNRLVGTAEHLVMTENDWTVLGDLTPGIEVQVVGDRGGQPRRPKLRDHRVTVSRLHPYAYDGGRIALHRVLVEARLSELEVDEFVRRVKSGRHEGLVFLDPKLTHVHHINENHDDNSITNLAVMSPEEHLRMHGDESSVLHRIKSSAVVGLRSVGRHETFDLSMADPPHNYIANGVVVHNSGKTETAVNIASQVPGQFRVLESDYSAAWKRIIATRYPNVANRAEITQVDDWESLVREFTRVVDEGDPDEDWIVIDSASPCSYEWVQEWVLDQIYGDELSAVLLEARKNARPVNGKSAGDVFKGQKLELMNWDLVKKEYRKFWRLIQRWKGHLILTAEAKQIGYWDKDDTEAQKVYGTIGYYPAGQQTIRHAMATTLYLDHPRAGQWRMTTVKDRGREELDKESVKDFGKDYLVVVGGWRRQKMSKAERLAALEE